MDQAFYKLLSESTAHRISREFIRDYVFQNPEKLQYLMEIGLNEKDKIHINEFLEKIGQYKNHSAIRPVSKICLFLSKSKTIKLTENQETKIIETCLDWLIQDEKVAAKAYSMITLYNFGKKYSWINEELKTILSQDFFKHSAAYKAAAKEILEKLK